MAGSAGEHARHLPAHRGAIAQVAPGEREEVVVVALVGEPAEEELGQVAPPVAHEIHREERDVQGGIRDPEAIKELDAVDDQRARRHQVDVFQPEIAVPVA